MKAALTLTTASLLLAASTAIAEPVTLDAKPQRISMFKNGLAMVTSRAEVPAGGEYRAPAPEARYGSLWISWEPGIVLDRIIVTEVERSEETDATNMTDLLRANVGRTFSIRLHDEDAWVTGTLTLMPTRPQPTPRPYIQPDRHGGYSPTIAPPVSDLLIFQTDDGALAVQPSQVARIRFDNGDVYTTVENTMTDTALSFTAEEADGEGDGVVLRYLAQGIAWSPSYAVEMIDDETARLACKAVIVNDLMDLNGVDVELIAGYPNLKFASSPTAMGPTPLAGLLASLQQAGQPSPYGVMSNTIVTQQRMSYDGGYGGAANYSTTIPDLPAGESAEDLYFYQVPGVTLAKGERGYFPLISAEVPGGHVYTWDIPDFIDRHDRYREQSEEPQQIVWHSLELTNTTDQPWTTAPGMTVKDGRVLGQDMLTFTPPGGTSLLKITKAVSIDADQSEVEVERERNAVTFHGSTYDKVTVEGTLSITNYKGEAVSIQITKLVSGEVAIADANPEVVKIAGGLNRVNPRSRLTWEADIEPGKENAVKIIYRYSFFTR
jgi:hypothetical protein